MARPNDQIAEADLPGYYRREAARFRSEADTAETVEMRIILLDWAQWTEQLATELEQCRP
jgi:hypothetical protein